MRGSTSLLPSPSQTTCGSLLQELQEIWDEIGENDVDRDKMLLELEQECLHIYRRKVESSRKYKSDLYEQLAKAKAEIPRMTTQLGVQSSFSWAKGTLKEQLSSVQPVLNKLRLKKIERIKEFSETQLQITRICSEISGNDPVIANDETYEEEPDLTMNRLVELKSYLKELQAEKALRLQKVNGCICSIHELSDVMSIDFKQTMYEIHPNLVDPECSQSKSISDETLTKLTNTIISLNEEKQERLRKIQDLGMKLIDLWDLLETPMDERTTFEHVTSLISVSVDDMSRKGCLSLDVIKQAENEVEMLKVQKGSKMKELVLKRQTELEEIYKEVHMEIDGGSAREILTSLIESGTMNLSDLLSHMDDQIRKAKEEAQSRKDILDKVEKWKHACEEEDWLDEYEKDDNRYSAGRGAHKNLKRAEKARILANKLPALVENLISKVKLWEIEKAKPFLLYKEPLLTKLEEYTSQRQHREEEKRKTRELKRLQEQLATEKEAIFGSRPAAKKPLGQNNNTGTVPGTPIARRLGTPLAQHGTSGSRGRGDTGKSGSGVHLSYVAFQKT
ncbi:hypothetical protein Droror1_Dr00020481 [Drosera rotundifolia]